MTIRSDLDNIRTKVLAGNTAQAVHKHLDALNELREKRRTRWIWELLQNARDVSTNVDKELITKVLYHPDKLIFLHNGRGFTREEITHLIYHGSTKVEDEDTIGKYGSGFLTTHLLSGKIKVSGKLAEQGDGFEFLLTREPSSVNALEESMHTAWENFIDSLSRQTSIPEGFTTQFTYPIEETKKDAVEVGINTLKQFAPFVLIFNPQFKSINIDNQGKMFCFNNIETAQLDESGIQQITATAGKSEIKKYLLAESELILAQDKKASVSVTVLIKSNGTVTECLGIGNTPRLFWGFPLVGTEVFSFPAVINSLGFNATEDRDGVPLAQGDTVKNRNNQNIIENACSLLVLLLQFAAAKGWHHIYQWAEVPPISDKDWINSEWLKTCIEDNLITKIIDTPIVLNEESNPIPPNASMLPIASDDINIEYLWKLLSQCQEFRSKLPRQQEVAGWCKTLKSWEGVCDGNISELSEAIIDGSKLVEIVENKWDFLEELQSELEEDVWAIDWLDKLYKFLKSTGLFNNEIRQLHLFPNQEGKLKPLTHLYKDIGIDEELKNIFELLESPIRHELRHSQLQSIHDEIGAGEKDNDQVLQNLTNKLRERVNENPDDIFREASVQLFSWIVRQKKYERLSDFPVLAADDKSIIFLPNPQTYKPQLAPVNAWKEGLQKYTDLFPSNRIMHDAYFEVFPNKDIWKELAVANFIRLNVLIQRDETDLSLLSPSIYENEEDKRDHHVDNPIQVTDFVHRDTIMSEVRNSRDRGYLFWQFLSEWLDKEDASSILKEQVVCSCGERHEYYSGVWLKSARGNSWIRDGDSRSVPNAKALGKLLREKEWELTALYEEENAFILKLLESLNVLPMDLKLEIIATNEEKRNEAVDLVTELWADDINTNQVREIVQDIKEDENLPQVLIVCIK